MFGKPSDWTMEDWNNSKAKEYLSEMPKNNLVWTHASKMSDKQKQEYPYCKTTRGCLRIKKTRCTPQQWWDKLEQHKKDAILALPNFDADIFEECTGIRV